MSGHSKWATIKRQKGAADVKRGLIFTKLSNAITVAVKKGGGITDPESNFRLRLAIEAAKSQNMPKETIERAITRALGKDGAILEEVTYEGYGPNGVSVIIEAATDKSSRTASQIKSVFSKEGGSFGQRGSVSYQFKQVGQIAVKKDGKSLDQIFDQAAECGAEDIEDGGDEVIIYTNYRDALKIRDQLSEKGLNIVNVDIIKKPIVIMNITDKTKFEKTISFLQKLEALDDVQKIYTNLADY